MPLKRWQLTILLQNGFGLVDYLSYKCFPKSVSCEDSKDGVTNQDKGSPTPGELSFLTTTTNTLKA